MGQAHDRGRGASVLRELTLKVIRVYLRRRPPSQTWAHGDESGCGVAPFGNVSWVPKPFDPLQPCRSAPCGTLPL
jgi:hypothetical protein